MKERNELARALTDLPDDLLLEGERLTLHKRTVKFHRLIAAAAVIALLAVTAYAASVGITWNVVPEQEKIEGHANSYYKDDDGVLDFEKLEYEIPMGVVTLPEQKLLDLESVLYRHWNLMQQEEYQSYHDWTPETPFVYESFGVDTYMESYLNRFGTNLKHQPAFGSLEDVEALLGIKLAVSQEIRETIRAEFEQGNPYALNVWIESGKTMGEAAEAKGITEVAKVVINYELDHFCGNGWVVGSIHIPLTEKAAQAGVRGIYYSYEKEGAIWQEEQTIDGRTVKLFGNDPEQGYAGWCKAIYTEGGAAYIVSSRVESRDPGRSYAKPFYDTGRDAVLAVLGDGE